MRMFNLQVVKLKERRVPKIKTVEVMDSSVRFLEVKIRKIKVMKELNRSGAK
jgi:hypothetical protein